MGSIAVHRIEAGAALRLADHDPRGTPAFDGDKQAGRQRLVELNARLEELQEALYAEGKQRLLVVLQALDAGGKDGTIRSVFDGVNPQGVKVKCFKRPTAAELAHDFLWRVHPHVPGDGEIAIWNRSHYEDVLVVRVHELVPERQWHKRLQHIAAFEQLLVDEGTVIRKFFLHISRDEQRERLQERVDNPEKHWKFRKGDLDVRAKWGDYMKAYQEALSRTSTKDAPWYVVPANSKWFRDLVVGSVVADALDELHMPWPEPEDDIEGLVIE